MFALLGVLAGGVIADELGGLQQLHGKAGQHVSKQDPQKLNQLPESVRSSELIARTDRGLRLTAALYVCHGAARHLRQTGRLPDAIGGPWSVIPMRHVIEERGIDFELTEDEELVYDAIIREGRLPGGAVRLVDPDGEAPSGGSSGELQKVIAESSGALDDRSVEFVTLLRHSGILGDEDWSQIIEELRDALRFLARPNRTVARDAEAHLVIDLDADPRNADWLRSASANRLAGHHLPLWSSLWLWRLGHDRAPSFWSKIRAAARDFGCQPFPPPTTATKIS
jgi:hypothetical protein